MICPHCGDDTKFVKRVIVMEVAFGNYVSADGSVGADCGLNPEVLEEVEGGAYGEWFLCPSCRGGLSLAEGGTKLIVGERE